MDLANIVKAIALNNTHKQNAKIASNIYYKYPFDVVTQHYSTTGLSPDKAFKEYVPGLRFTCLPLQDGTHWMFETSEDRELFIALLLNLNITKYTKRNYKVSDSTYVMPIFYKPR